MKELNEKDLEMAAGGYVSPDYCHRSDDCCGLFEPDYDTSMPEEITSKMRCCSHCIHGEKKNKLIGCLLSVPGDGRTPGSSFFGGGQI